MPSARQSAVKAIRSLTEAGHEAYFAGGCVRDLLLDRAPKDYDIATSATPDEVQSILRNTKAIGKAFGVIQAHVDGHRFEIATFRADHDYADGRHPTAVTFTDAKTDASRRDFTINAIFFDPLTNRHLDFCDGISDLKKRVLRCVGRPSQRFKEDHLRMLRAIRFAAVLDFRIGKKTSAAIQRHAKLITGISSERIHDELLRILTEAPLPGRALLNMHRLGLLAHVLPLTYESCSEHQLRTIATALDNMPARDAVPMLAALLIRTGAHRGKRVARPDLPAMTASTELELRNLKCSGKHTRDALKAQALYWRIVRSRGDMSAEILPELIESYAEIAVDLMTAQCKPYAEQIARLRPIVKSRLERPLITGNDLISIGVEPGPDMKAMLSKARILQAQGKVTSKKDMLKAVRQS